MPFFAVVLGAGRQAVGCGLGRLSIRTFLGVEGVHWDGGRLATVGRNGQLQGLNPATSPGSGRRGLKISLPLRGAHHNSAFTVSSKLKRSM